METNKYLKQDEQAPRWKKMSKEGKTEVEKKWLY